MPGPGPGLSGSRRRDWRFWVSVAAFCVVPTVGIALFLLLVRPGRAGDG